MRNFCGGLILMLAAGVLFSCGSKNEEKKFFDVPGYFKGEVAYVKSNFSTVLKTTKYNGNSTKKEFNVSDINWDKEFGLFMECDINKPAYYTSMNIQDSPSWYGNPEEAKRNVAYNTTNKSLDVRDVIIEYQKETVIGIGIHYEKSNLISTTSIDATYMKDSSYTIFGEQRIRNLGNKNTFYVRGEFK